MSTKDPQQEYPEPSTFSPIGDTSFRLILPRSISPINSPMVSSSRMMRMNGSHMLHDLILGLGVLPSRSLMLCRSVPSRHQRQRHPPGGRCIRTSFKHPGHVEHDMKNCSSLEERRGTEGQGLPATMEARARSWATQGTLSQGASGLILAVIWGRC